MGIFFHQEDIVLDIVPRHDSTMSALTGKHEQCHLSAQESTPTFVIRSSRLPGQNSE
jgi:hypothetical protein